MIRVHALHIEINVFKTTDANKIVTYLRRHSHSSAAIRYNAECRDSVAHHFEVEFYESRNVDLWIRPNSIANEIHKLVLRE